MDRAKIPPSQSCNRATVPAADINRRAITSTGPSPVMECVSDRAPESPWPSALAEPPPAPPLLPMSPSMILAMEFPENEAWLESAEKTAQEAKSAGASKTWRLFGSSSGSMSSPAATESGRKSPYGSSKDEDVEPSLDNINSKDEEDAAKKSLSTLLGVDTAADQLARALGSVAGLGVSPALLTAQEGFARKVSIACPSLFLCFVACVATHTCYTPELCRTRKTDLHMFSIHIDTRLPTD